MLTSETIIQNRYQIVRLIGRGGTGAVYEAVDLRLDMRVALKQTTIPAEQSANLLEREARLLARLRHPALPRVIDHFVDGQHQYLVMEFIDGDDLGVMLLQRNYSFEVQRVLKWADQLLAALEYLHRQSPPVLHRDIKPQNLKLTAEDDIVLLDFGLAKGGAVTRAVHRANESIFGYTPHYASLEQINSAGTEPRSDLYSLAATLYHLLTGIQPPDALTRATALLRRLPDPLIAPDALNAAIPAEVSRLLMRTLALNPDDRPESATAMRAMIAQILMEAGASMEDVRPSPIQSRPDANPASTYTVRQSIAKTQHSPSLESGTSHDAADQRPVPAALTQHSPPVNGVGEPLPGTWSSLQTVRAHLRRVVQRAVAWLPHPWNRYAVPASGVIVATLITLGILLATGSQHSMTALVSTVQEAEMSPTASVAAPTAASVAPPVLPTSLSRTSETNTASTASVSVQAQPVALRMTPAEAYAGDLPITLRVEGQLLDQVRRFALESPDTGALPLEVDDTSATAATLVLTALPATFTGEATLLLTLDSVPQPDVAIRVRDFLERRIVAGVRPEYAYTAQIGADERGAYTSLHIAPDAASDRFAVLRNGDTVEILRNDEPGWYQVRIRQSATTFHLNAVGWIERWLIDDENVPQPVFAGVLGQTPTDAAVRCGAQFRSSIYGSVEDRNGRGIGGATLTVTSADGRNRFTARTRANGTYEVSGLGCTVWIVRLTSVPDFPAFQANEVRVINLNGGRYTAAEVRFRLQP